MISTPWATKLADLRPAPSFYCGGCGCCDRHFCEQVLECAVINSQERADLILSFARVLHVNGESTDATIAATERLGSNLGLSAKVIPRWGELELQVGDSGTIPVAVGAADPTGVDMDRVASAMRAIDDIIAGRLAPSEALKTINAISQAPPAPTWLFTLAAATGAAALSVIFGVQHPAAVVLISFIVGAGAVLSRLLVRYRTTPLLPPICAALTAG